MFQESPTPVPTRPFPASSDWRQFARFVVVGGAFAGGYAVVTALLVGVAGMPAFVTSTVVYALCIPLAYLAQKSFAFRTTQARKAGFLVYGSMQVLCMMLVSWITSRFVSGVVLVDTALFLGTAGLAAVASYAVSRFAVFRPGE
jgi:putative flippase GtrA